MTIEQLVSVLNNVEVKGDVNKEIEFITHDSRRVRKNTLFVCICGTRVDGNKFIPQQPLFAFYLGTIIGNNHLDDDVFYEGVFCGTLLNLI